VLIKAGFFGLCARFAMMVIMGRSLNMTVNWRETGINWKIISDIFACCDFSLFILLLEKSCLFGDIAGREEEIWQPKLQRNGKSYRRKLK